MSSSLLTYVCSCKRKVLLADAFVCAHCIQLVCHVCGMREVTELFCMHCLRPIDNDDGLHSRKISFRACPGCRRCPSCGTSMFPSGDKPDYKCAHCGWNTTHLRAEQLSLWHVSDSNTASAQAFKALANEYGEREQQRLAESRHEASVHTEGAKKVETSVRLALKQAQEVADRDVTAEGAEPAVADHPRSTEGSGSVTVWQRANQAVEIHDASDLLPLPGLVDRRERVRCPTLGCSHQVLRPRPLLKHTAVASRDEVMHSFGHDIHYIAANYVPRMTVYQYNAAGGLLVLRVTNPTEIDFRLGLSYECRVSNDDSGQKVKVAGVRELHVSPSQSFLGAISSRGGGSSSSLSQASLARETHSNTQQLVLQLTPPVGSESKCLRISVVSQLRSATMKLCELPFDVCVDLAAAAPL